MLLIIHISVTIIMHNFVQHFFVCLLCTLLECMGEYLVTARSTAIMQTYESAVYIPF
jgi:hypothetical protein